MKKSVTLGLAVLVFGMALGAGVVALVDRHTSSLYDSEAMAIALAATLDAHNHGRVPAESDFVAMEEKMFPPRISPLYGGDSFMAYGTGATKYAFIFGNGKQLPQPTYVCFTIPVTLGDIPHLTSC
jgi:hypothetical protein